jgi:intein/homing endonuclease
MPVPKHGVTIYDKVDNIHKISDLVEELRKQPDRVLIDDEFGISVDISDLDYYVYSFDLEKQENKKAKISTLHHRKKKAQILRVNLENGVAVEVSEDTLFHVKTEDGQLKYVRADKLEPGMAVLSGITPNGPGVIVY